MSKPTYSYTLLYNQIGALDLKCIASISSIIESESHFYSKEQLRTLYGLLAARIIELKSLQRLQ